MGLYLDGRCVILGGFLPLSLNCLGLFVGFFFFTIVMYFIISKIFYIL